VHEPGIIRRLGHDDIAAEDRNSSLDQGYARRFDEALKPSFADDTQRAFVVPVYRAGVKADDSAPLNPLRQIGVPQKAALNGAHDTDRPVG
jgi:hypothetical protein